MKRIILLSYFTCCIFHFTFSQNPLVKQWDYRFGGTDNDLLYSIQQTGDNGYILAGYTLSDSSGDKTQNRWGGYDYWIVKTDSVGTRQWDKNFGGTLDDIFSSVQQTPDGGYILGGYSNSGISGDKSESCWGGYDYWMVKTDANGNKQWDKTFGGFNFDFLRALEQTNDGGYILGGYSFSGISGDKTQANWDTSGSTCDYWIVKTDSSGNMQWDIDLGGTGYDFFFSIQQTAEGGYIGGGYSFSDSSGDKTQNTWGNADYWIVKIDSMGNKQWDKDFGGTDGEALSSLKQTSDEGYILGGTSESGISGDKTQALWGGNDYWIVKTDMYGNKQWDKDFGGTDIDEMYDIRKTADGGYLFFGDSYSPVSGNKTENNLGPEQMWILKTDSIGNKQWDKTIFTTGHDEQGMGVQAHDGCYAFACQTSAGTGGYKSQPNQDSSGITADYWIIKFCDTSATTSIFQVPDNSISISISPNPTTNNFIVTFPNTINKGSIEIYTVLGKKIFIEDIFNVSQKEVRLKNVAGIYFVKVRDEEKEYCEKLVIE